MCNVTLESGRNLVKVVELVNGKNIIEIEHNRVVVDLEFVIENRTGKEIRILRLEMLDNN